MDMVRFKGVKSGCVDFESIAKLLKNFTTSFS